MAWAFVNSAVAGSGSTMGVACAKPTDTAENDIMFALMTRRASVDPNSIPTGWTLLAESDVIFHSWLYYKVAGASEPANYTWSWAASAKEHINIVTFRGGFTTSDPIDGISNTKYDADSTAIIAANITINDADSPVVFFGAVTSDSTKTFTPPFGFTEHLDSGNATNGAWHCVDSKVFDADNTGEVRAICSATTTYKCAFMVSLKTGTAHVLNDTRIATAVGVNVETTSDIQRASALGASVELGSDTQRITSAGTMMEYWAPDADTRVGTALGISSELGNRMATTGHDRVVSALGLMVEILFGPPPPVRVLPSKVRHIWLVNPTGDRRVLRNAQ